MNYRHVWHLGCLAAVGLVFSGCMALQQHKAQTETAPAAAQAESAAEADQEVVVIDVPGEEEAAAPEAAPKLVALPMAPKPAPAPKAKPKPAVQAKPAPKPAPAAEPEPAEPEMAAVVTPAPAAVTPFDHYEVAVSTDDKIVTIGQPVSLRVFVDAPGYPLSGNDAHGVKVTFTGIGFADETPAVECLRAHPNGSEIIYNLTAAYTGSYNVVANVSVYPTRDCESSSIQKKSVPLKLSVK